MTEDSLPSGARIAEPHPAEPHAADRDVPVSFAGKLESNYFCRAWNPRREKYCRCRAGRGTEHKGSGRCRTHDGGGDEKLQHGQSRRYAAVRTERLRTLIAAHQADPDPLDILPELAAARALFQDHIERYEQFTDALLAWHESYEPGARPIGEDRRLALAEVLDEYESVTRESSELTDKQRDDLELARDTLERLATPNDGKPRRILDIADARNTLAEITRIVERIEKIRAQNAISLPELERLMFEMGRVVKHHAPPDAYGKIADGWLGIRTLGSPRG